MEKKNDAKDYSRKKLPASRAFYQDGRDKTLAGLVENPPHFAEGMRAVGGNSLNEYEGTAVIAKVDTDVHTRD
ncbi:MAG: hypothetical protein WA476_13550 [Acidobacteriaceae bacterium]